MAKPIPREINEDETIVRCVFHHIHYSRSKGLKRESFLPAPDKIDVSVLRRKYTKNDTYCKNHCQSISMEGQTYVGMCVILARHIREVRESNKVDISVEIKSTPLDREKNRIPNNEDIFTNTPGIPAHADILYEFPVKEGEPWTKHRAFANELLKLSTLYLDANVNGNEWTDQELEWKSN